MSRALATLSFSIGMMAARMVLPTMLVSWRRWRMAVSTLWRATLVIPCARTATLWDIMRFMATVPRLIDNPKRSPAAYVAGYIVPIYLYAPDVQDIIVKVKAR